MEPIIKFVCNYNSDYNIYNLVNDVWNIDGKHHLTYGNDYTHLIIFNKYDKNLIKVEKNNVYGIIHEPYWSGFFDKNLPSMCNKVYHYQPEKFIGYDNVIKTPFIGTHHLWDKQYKGEVMYKPNTTKNIISKEYIKTKKLSIILNNHGEIDYSSECIWKKRQELARKLLSTNIDFDMYGIDWNLNDKRFKGYVVNKLDALKDYEYTLSLENSPISAEITEKFIDPILCGTIPIYNGHKDIELYYPNSYEYLEYGDNVIDDIYTIINSNKTKYDYDLDGAKYRFLNDYNPINLIKNDIKYGK